MYRLFFYVVATLIMWHPIASFANDDVIEIPLMEIIPAGSLEGDSPLDGHKEIGTTPTHPNEFRAFIAGNTLSVSNSTATLPTQLIVRDNLGSVVVNRQFTQYAAQQMPVGAFTLELHTTSFTLQGYFEVNQ